MRFIPTRYLSLETESLLRVLLPGFASENTENLTIYLINRYLVFALKNFKILKLCLNSFSIRCRFNFVKYCELFVIITGLK